MIEPTPGRNICQEPAIFVRKKLSRKTAVQSCASPHSVRPTKTRTNRLIRLIPREIKKFELGFKSVCFEDKFTKIE